MTAKSKYFNGLLFVLFSCTFNTYGQEYNVKTSIETVPATGFYKIPVTPVLTGFAKSDLSDVRIVTDSNTFVPYINQREVRTVKPEAFTTFPILSNTTEGRYTTIILENSLTAGATNLSLAMSNTAVERYTAVSGSDDKNKWYIIDDSILFHRSYRNTDGNYIQTISFPLSKYKYFKLKINNAGSDPLRIVNAGVYKNADMQAGPGFINNPPAAFTQKDSGNISYIIIKNESPWLVRKVNVQVNGPKFYNRSALAYIMHDKNDSSTLNDPVTTCTVSSDKPCTFDLNEQKVQTIILEIDNKDNPAVKVINVSTSQEQQYLVAWLEKGKTYSLLAGNPKASAPQYDLSHFKNDIPATLPSLSVGPVTAIPSTPTLSPVKPITNYWLWPTIIVAVIILSLLTYRLMKDMKQS